MSVPNLSYWRTVTPSFPEIRGQGDLPTGFQTTVQGADGSPVEVALPWGSLVRASAATDPGREVGNLEVTPILLRPAIVGQLADLGVLSPVPESE